MTASRYALENITCNGAILRDSINFLKGRQLYVSEQVQRVGGQLVRRATKTESSEAPLPLPDLCIAAFKLPKQQQNAGRERAGDAWIDTGLVFTTRHGTPIEPRNFNRVFDRRIAKVGVSKITVHGTRKTCGTLLAALDVHPRVAMQILISAQTHIWNARHLTMPSMDKRSGPGKAAPPVPCRGLRARP